MPKLWQTRNEMRASNRFMIKQMLQDICAWSLSINYHNFITQMKNTHSTLTTLDWQKLSVDFSHLRSFEGGLIEVQMAPHPVHSRTKGRIAQRPKSERTFQQNIDCPWSAVKSCKTSRHELAHSKLCKIDLKRLYIYNVWLDFGNLPRSRNTGFVFHLQRCRVL